MSERVRRLLPAAIGATLFAAAVITLRHELRSIDWTTLLAATVRTPRTQLAWAAGLTVLNYLLLTGYDLIACASIGTRLARGQVMLASFLSYAISNNVGFAMISGASVRYRFYSRWGVTAEELPRIIFSYSVTFWLGLLALGGVSLAVSPLPFLGDLPARPLVVSAGWLLFATSVGYVLLTAVRQRPLRIGRFELPLPSPRLAGAQWLLSTVDWALAAGVLYALLPASPLSFAGLLAAFLAAQGLGLVSHVPGGLGVFEGLMVLLLSPFMSSADLLPALLLYRAIYYLVPLAIALVVMVVDETRERREHVARVGAMFDRVTEQVTPRIVATFTFFAGLLLLFSDATPAAEGRLEFLSGVLPLGMIEASHFLSSLAGAVLLLLSQGLARRLDAAYVLTVIALAVGMVTSLFKGGDYEEAALLVGVLLILWRARPAFDRRAALFDAPFSVYWAASIAAALSASIWLGMFAFKHVEYSRELWWQFELYGEASRFLRASVGATVVVLLFAVSRLLRHAAPDAPEPTDAELAEAAAIIATQTSTFPNLVYLRDKSLLFNDARTAFVMYSVPGRTWVAMGDPVGPRDCHADLIRTFLERCDDHGGVPVFYEVHKESLHQYADLGLTFVKLGEEAVVDLQAFTFEGGGASKHRQALRRLDKEGVTFRIVPAEEVAAIVGQLRDVSNDWLEAKSGAEKGFSLGFFDDAYVSRFPVAVIEKQGRVMAFGNLWLSACKTELSVDLMRYHRDAPTSVMEMLFVQLLRWGKEQGYQRFALGMAPLSGVEASPVAPLWNRIGAFLYEHGEAIYRFQGLRAYKDKFDPIWEPHYLAYVGGMRLPLIMADVSALIAGGYRRIFLK